ncbi:MAG: hypothetical protein J0H49_00845 [Acidobacteria bacterium]|nr:hypothetical protein [Acidobacteriota bacterium]
MDQEIDRLKTEFRAAITAERHAAAASASTSLLDILTASYRSDRKQWEEALELWHWAQRTARSQRSHLDRERKAAQVAPDYGSCKLRLTSTFSVDG